MFVKIILIPFIILFSTITISKTDHDVVAQMKLRDDSISSSAFNKELSDTRELMQQITHEHYKAKFEIYGSEKFIDYVFATPIISETLGWANVMADGIFDGLNLLADTEYENKLEKAAQGAIYNAWKQDRLRIENAFRSNDHVVKTQAVIEVLNELDDFGEYLGGNILSTDQRAVLNSRMILKLADITKNIGVETLKNTSEIEKLKEAKRDFEKYKKNNLENLKQFIDFQFNSEKLSLELHQSTSRSLLKISSVIENDEYSQEDIRTGNISEDDSLKLDEAMQEIASAMGQAEQYLGKMSTIANNLLDGKDAERANKILFYASNGVKIIGGVARAYGNDPMGAMDAMVGVSNLLGKNKLSPEQKRHQQIMQAFQQVFKNQKIIIENQKRMYELQIKTYKLVAKLYNLTKHNFTQLNERIDVIIGNQSSTLLSVRKFANITENLNYCKSFLNTRFQCSSAHLEKDGDIFNCIAQIKDQDSIGDFRDSFTPYNQQTSSVIIQGFYNSYDNMIAHFDDDQNKASLSKCHDGLSALLQEEVHPLFLTSIYPIDGALTTYNEKFLIPVYDPLMNLVKKYFTNTKRKANSFYRALLIPHKSSLSLSLKSQKLMSIHNDINDHLLLTQDQIQNGLYNHIYLPALDHYMSSFNEIASYWDLIDGDINLDFELLNKKKLIEKIDNQAGNDLISKYEKLTKLIELSIAQQNLISGDIMLPLLRKIAKTGKNHVDYENVEKALMNNNYLATNLFTYSLSSEFDSKSSPELFYSAYNEYLTNGLGDCKWNDKESSYGAKCQNIFLTQTSLPYVFTDKGIFLHDSKKAKVETVSVNSLKEKKLIYNPHFYRTLRLKQQLYTFMNKFKNVTKSVLKNNPYVYP